MNPLHMLSKIQSWTTEYLRPLLSLLGNVEFAKEVDRHESLLQGFVRRFGEVPSVCLLGQAGVGKSTLLNTLIDDLQIVVPSGGGTGPLTANALSVRYGETPSFSVRYHTRQKINQLRFVIDAAIKRGGSASNPASIESESLDSPTDDLPKLEMDSEQQRSSRLEESIRSALLLIAGGQTKERSLPYLSDALRAILGTQPHHEQRFDPEDAARIQAIRDALDWASRNSERHFETSDPSFTQWLRYHACGFLAPLIQEMAITWPSSMLGEGVQIVDLPGIGIVSDVYANVTADYLRNRARGVILVTDSRGLRREDAELLRNSGFLNRLLHCVDDPTADPVVLMVVVVKIDDVAAENWRNDRQMNGTSIRSKSEHFADVVASCTTDVSRQVEQFLKEVWASNDRSLSDEKLQVIRTLMETLEVHPVSAPQYRLHHTNDPDEPKPFLKSPEHSNIPKLRDAVIRVARNHRDRVLSSFEEGTRRFFGLVAPRLEIIAAERETSDVSPQLKEMRMALDELVAPMQLEFENRRGAFRSYLRKSVPEHIKDKTEVAAARAEREINGYLGELEGAHWSTLRAAVRREGTFYGARHINLPHDFSLRFEEPLAEIWAKGILKGLREATGEFAEYQEQTVTEIINWAKGRGSRVPKLLDALLSNVQENRKALNLAGREAIDELRAQVRQDLIKKIEGPIRRRCQKFVNDHEDVGRGVKRRILDLFAELSAKVIEDALEPARDLLLARCREAEKDILQALKDHANPISEACDALLERHERKLKRDLVYAVTAEEIRGVIATLESLRSKADQTDAA